MGVATGTFGIASIVIATGAGNFLTSVPRDVPRKYGGFDERTAWTAPHGLDGTPGGREQWATGRMASGRAVSPLSHRSWIFFPNVMRLRVLRTSRATYIFRKRGMRLPARSSALSFPAHSNFSDRECPGCC